MTEEVCPICGKGKLVSKKEQEGRTELKYSCGHGHIEAAITDKVIITDRVGAEIREAKKLVKSVKEDFSELRSTLQLVEQKSLAEKTYEKVLEIEKRLTAIEQQTRPQTWWQKLRAEIFSGIIGWIVALVLGILLLILGVKLFL